jgi:hypothetical protein
LLDLGRPADALIAARAALDSASHTGHAARQAQAGCLLRWAQAVSNAAPLASRADASAAGPADADPLTGVSCALAQAQALRAQAQWADLQRHLDTLLKHAAPEPQWTVDARLLRAEAQLQQGRPGEAATEARAALTEARRLQDGAADSWRTRAAQDLLSRAER